MKSKTVSFRQKKKNLEFSVSEKLSTELFERFRINTDELSEITQSVINTSEKRLGNISDDLPCIELERMVMPLAIIGKFNLVRRVVLDYIDSKSNNTFFLEELGRIFDNLTDYKRRSEDQEHIDELLREVIRLDRNPNVRMGKKNETPLILAARTGDEELVDWLLEQNVIIGIKDNDRNSAFYHASKNGHLGIVKKLIGAVRDYYWTRDENMEDKKAAAAARDSGYKEVSSFIEAQSLSRDEEQEKVEEPVTVELFNQSIKDGAYDIATELVRNGKINPTRVFKIKYREGAESLYEVATPMVANTAIAELLLIQSSGGGYGYGLVREEALTKILIKGGVNPNALDEYGSNEVLANALMFSQEEAAVMLIEAGADLEQITLNYSLRPIENAILTGSSEAIGAMLDRGINLRPKIKKPYFKHNVTPLSVLAVQSNNVAVLEQFLKRGILTGLTINELFLSIPGIDFNDGEDKTELFELFVKYGATNFEETLMTAVTWTGSDQIISFILKKGVTNAPQAYELAKEKKMDHAVEILKGYIS